MNFLLLLANLDSKYPKDLPQTGRSNRIWVSWTDSRGKSHRGKVSNVFHIIRRVPFKYNSSGPMDETDANALGKKSNSWILSHMEVDKFKYLMIHNSEYFCFFTDNDMQKFAAFYRSKFPKETFPPKFHMLEDHVVPFFKKWKFPLGFFGKQGGKSIHHEFKLFKQTNISVKPASECLKKMLKQHYVVDVVSP